MAQMTASLADLADRPSRRWLPPEVTKEARRLARAYDELAVYQDTEERVPCAALLREITTQLALIFGRSRQVALVVTADAIHLPPDVRRALLLVASELVINALKYGYPVETGGTIAVSLVAREGSVELIVEDDGIGMVDSYHAGHGGGLLGRLAVVLGATVTRTAAAMGHGFRVSTLVPTDMAKDDPA